jgi:hypothetical protein
VRKTHLNVGTRKVQRLKEARLRMEVEGEQQINRLGTVLSTRYWAHSVQSSCVGIDSDSPIRNVCPPP